MNERCWSRIGALTQWQSTPEHSCLLIDYMKLNCCNPFRKSHGFTGTTLRNMKLSIERPFMFYCCCCFFCYAMSLVSYQTSTKQMYGINESKLKKYQRNFSFSKFYLYNAHCSCRQTLSEWIINFSMRFN